MLFWKRPKKRIKYPEPYIEENFRLANDDGEDFCTKCDAILDYQEGYSRDLLFWVCRSCGTMLTSPDTDVFEITGGAVWQCDKCGELLNIQKGFSREKGVWRCTECGYKNDVTDKNLFETEAEAESMKQSPFYGLSDEDVIEILKHVEVRPLSADNTVYLVENRDTKQLLVRKYLKNFNLELLKKLKEAPIPGMPRIYSIIVGPNALILYEEYIEGETLQICLENGPLYENEVKRIILELLKTLKILHSMNPPVIHRDIKPENIIIKPDGTPVLIDVDTAKQFKQNEVEDTVLLGTREYAAPEQYGFLASDNRTDIYAVGILMNYMLTKQYPKYKMAEGAFANIIKRCIKLDPDNRYQTVDELTDEFGKI